MDAYVISDRASWLNFGNKGNLGIVFSGDPALFNQYAYLPANPEKGENILHSSALQLEVWLTSDRAKALINGYQIDGQPLFVFNATP
jgi:tungstate transport system substrate-binding protein